MLQYLAAAGVPLYTGAELRRHARQLRFAEARLVLQQMEDEEEEEEEGEEDEEEVGDTGGAASLAARPS